MLLRLGFFAFFFAFVLSPVAALPAFAADPAVPAAPVNYIAPTWADLLRTAVRFNAIDLSDDRLLDEYAAVTDCDIYKFYFNDDFKWQEVRKKMRESSAMNAINYPTHYYVRAILTLSRYDFDKKIFSFAEGTAIHAVNVFKLFDPMSGNACNEKTPVKYIPKTFRAVASKPFTSPGIPMSPADAQSLLRLMNADKNTDRQVIAKFNLTITYIAHLHKEAVNPGTVEKDPIYTQIGESQPGTMRMDAQIDSIEFYEDAAMTKLIYSTKPSL